MPAIKLPVVAYAQSNAEQLWSVRDDNNFRICRDLTRKQANQVVTALNLHDELIEALKAAIEEVRMFDGSCYTYRTGRSVLVRAENATDT